MKKNYLYYLIAFLFFLNIYSIYKQVNFRKQLIKVNEVSKELSAINNSASDNLKKTIAHGYNNIKLKSKNVEVLNILNEDKVVLYITEGNCGNCIQEALNYFDNLGEIIGKDKLLFMGNFETEKKFNNYAYGLSGFMGNSVYCNDAGFSKEMNQHPLVFLVKKDLSIQALFIPDFYPKFAEEYYTKVLPSYFEKENLDAIL